MSWRKRRFQTGSTALPCLTDFKWKHKKIKKGSPLLYFKFHGFSQTFKNFEIGSFPPQGIKNCAMSSTSAPSGSTSSTHDFSSASLKKVLYSSCPAFLNMPSVDGLLVSSASFLSHRPVAPCPFLSRLHVSFVCQLHSSAHAMDLDRFSLASVASLGPVSPP